MKKLFFYLVAILLCSCQGNSAYSDFEIEEEGGEQIVLQIPMDYFLGDLLGNYTDPGLREILSQCGDVCSTAPVDYITSMVRLSMKEGYEMAHYFNYARPDEFLENADSTELKDLLTEKYLERCEANYTILHNRLLLDSIQHNIRIAESGEIVVEFKEEKSLAHLRSIVAGNDQNQVHIEETYMLYELIDSLRKIDSLWSGESPLNRGSVGNLLFGNRWDLPGKVNETFGFVVADMNSPILGLVAAGDTAAVMAILNEYRDLLPTDARFTWMPNISLLGDPSTFLFILRRQPEPKLLINSWDIFISQPVRYLDAPDFGVQLMFHDKGTDKWNTLMERNVARGIAVSVGNELICVHVVLENMPYGICEMRQNYTEAEAQALSTRISSSLFPHPLCIQAEKHISSKGQ